MSEALSSILPQQPWKMTDGSFVSCVEKLKILNQNYEEIRQQCLDAYEDAINHTSTSYAPWYVIPADKKWFAKFAVSEIIKQTLESLNLKYPELNKTQKSELKNYKEILLKERK